MQGNAKCSEPCTVLHCPAMQPATVDCSAGECSAVYRIVVQGNVAQCRAGGCSGSGSVVQWITMHRNVVQENVAAWAM